MELERAMTASTVHSWGGVIPSSGSSSGGGDSRNVRPGKDHIILFEHHHQLEVPREFAVIELGHDVRCHQVCDVWPGPPVSSEGVAHRAGAEGVADAGPATSAALTALVLGGDTATLSLLQFPQKTFQNDVLFNVS